MGKPNGELFRLFALSADGFITDQESYDQAARALEIIWRARQARSLRAASGMTNKTYLIPVGNTANPAIFDAIQKLGNAQQMDGFYVLTTGRDAHGILSALNNSVGGATLNIFSIDVGNSVLSGNLASFVQGASKTAAA